MFGPKELMVVLIVLAIVLLVFGPKRIKSLGSELGNAIKGFRHAVRDKDAEAEASSAETASGPAQSVAHEPAVQDAAKGSVDQKRHV